MVLFIVVASAIILLAAYFTYGKFLANTVFKLDDKNPVPSVEMETVFKLDDKNPVPSVEMEDGVDYVPAKKGMLLGQCACQKRHAFGPAFFGHCRGRAY